MKVPFILNDPPYGTERSYNGLRLANNLERMLKGLLTLAAGKVLVS
jgi:sulfur relay (sulfurtransferase) complex TusBCD TusD component (DsrE family)